MKYRIRYHLTIIAILPLMALSWNAGHTSGLDDMMKSYETKHGAALQTIADIRKEICKLPMSGAVCVPMLPVRKPV